MSKIDIMMLANDFVLEIDQPLVVRLEIAKGMVAAAVEYINSRSKSERETIFNNVMEFAEDRYAMVLPDKVFDSYVAMITRMIRSANYDKRVVIKLETKSIGAGYLTANIGMDLEATATRLGWDTSPVEPEKESVLEAIVDSPSLDNINEFNKLDVPRSGIESPLSPNRNAKFVRKDPRITLALYSWHSSRQILE